MSPREPAQRHLIPHFTRSAVWRAADLPVLERGKGCYVWDTSGERWLDGLSGLFCVNIGHGREDLADAAAAQMRKLAFATNWGYAHPPSLEASRMIAELAPGDLDHVFFVSSGSEAVESALKLARNHHLARGETKRVKVIARTWSYHGTTLGALSVTGIPAMREPFAPMLWDGVVRVPNTLDAEPGAPGASARELPCVREIEAAILREGPENVSMLIAEPVQNGRGAVVAPDGYWPELRRICDAYGVLLCADEVINAFGRLGHWFASDRVGVVPDLITFAKGVTSAYQPLAGVVARRGLVEAIWDSPGGSFVHGSTFGGHPVATAVAVANMTALREEKVLENVLANEGYLRARLEAVAARHACVREVRGQGYFYAVELMADRESGRDLDAAQTAALRGGLLLQYIREAKILIRPDDRGATFMAIAPPLVADRAVLDDVAERLDRICTRVDQFLGGKPR
ncbi:MAG: aminotransferase class III-fold pyridoxal phosphate-dependent enzyme [Deltaproteobacteria bacterium]|nr:aminotransferase class III-fold pyridoxal phosphate-dependent enzyme [Deltaproteobacteria bacterium]